MKCEVVKLALKKGIGDVCHGKQVSATFLGHTSFFLVDINFRGCMLADTRSLMFSDIPCVGLDHFHIYRMAFV